MFAEEAPAGTLRYALRLPRQTPSNNELKGMHFQVYRKTRKEWCLMVLAALKGVRPAKPLTRCQMVITRFSSGSLDWDNYAGGIKPLLDSLVVASARNPDGCGLIANDDPKAMPECPTMRQEKCAPKQGYTEVLIYEV